MARRKRLPRKLPKTVHSALGPVAVEMVPGLKDEKGHECLGMWNPVRRVIQICQGLAPVTAWHTLYHERAHVAFWDAGLTMLKERDIEHACDAIATAAVAEMLGE